MSGFGALAARYQGFILDLWGVVHDGVRPLPGVADTLGRLAAAGKPVVFLSNAPRRAAPIARMLEKMGIGPEFYTAIVSSGEAVFEGLRDRTDPDFARLGRRVFHLGPARDRNVFETLDITAVERPDEADFLLNTGPDDERGEDDPALYDETLRACAASALPMVCANPDLEVMRDGKRIICAGLLAERYAAMGAAPVILRGKPDPAIYRPVLARLGTARAATLAVGDSLRTDLAGARAAGIDALWVLSGIHAVDPAAAPAVARGAGYEPVRILPGLGW